MIHEKTQDFLSVHKIVFPYTKEIHDIKKDQPGISIG